ncbi:metal-binding protein [Chroococcidiopsis sp. CCMEE 29]|uniref:metal-binding protein n=1 Tax=Chroococcidiopsis sp. CCMEE 29 TaxID=155894 RepID=UPI0020224F55|nr:metal-binding protein [Chroococcidiopsis sp. CCMEE 29]
MPSGRTHDRITLWGLPFLTALTFGHTQSGNITLIVSGAFLFSGLMFGPDLDIYSVQYKRWGYLRWVWIPYQKTLRHRSLLSHGLIIGTTLRILYLGCWLGILGIFLLGIAQLVWDVGWSWQLLVKSVQQSLTQHTGEWLALYLGLELGAMSHAVSDWGSSVYKRFQKQGSRGLLPRGKMKKRKLPPRSTRRSRSAVVKRRPKH